MRALKVKLETPKRLHYSLKRVDAIYIYNIHCRLENGGDGKVDLIAAV
jgi:hypothetical protein